MSNKENQNHNIIILLAFFIICLCISPISNYFAHQRFKKTSYKGIIVLIYNDESNHNTTIFKINTSDNNLIEESSDSFYQSWEYAEIGDSILKEKGVSYIIIKKKNGDDRMFYFE